MKVKMLITDGDAKAGDIVDVSERQGKEMIEHKWAELIEEPAPVVEPIEEITQEIEPLLTTAIPPKENLPPELLELKQFILWFEEDRGTKKTKVPAAPWKTGHWMAASATNPENWATFDTAVEYAKQKEGYGIGFSLKTDGGIVAMDLDNCIDNEGKISAFATNVFKRADSYVEVSPSGKGLHVFIHGNLADKVVKDGKIEIYCRDRYFTLTGRRLKEGPLALNSNDELLEELLSKYWERPTPAIVDKAIDKSVMITRIFDVSKLRRVGKQLQGTHPIHGSTTGANFAINEEKNVWYCYRHGSGGGPLSLLGVVGEIVKCEDCVPGRIRGETFTKIINLAKERGLVPQEWVQEEELTDKFITDRIMDKYQFYCDRDDEATTLYIWGGVGWRNGIAEGTILNELSEIFKGEDLRHGMALERTVNFIKGQAMNRQLNQKPPRIIPFVNGLYDAIDDKLLPHDASFFYVNVIPHEFNPTATCPNWEKWLGEVIREEDIKFVQEWAGYQFYTDYPEPGFLINLGKGQNGKTIFMDILQKIIGEKNISNVSLSDIVNGPYAMSELHQKLANISDEISNRAVRDAGPLKMISAGSYVEARQIYGKHFNFRNYAKPTYACNEPPEFRDESDAIKYRLKAVEFPYTFSKKPAKGEKQARDRKKIETELENEIPGIINWALEGLKRLIASSFTFTESRSTEETWNFYKRKSSPVACFIEEGLDFTENPEDVLSRDEIYQAFSAWLKDSKVDLNVSRDKFFKSMKACGVEATQSREYDRQRVYIGIKCHSVTPVHPPKTPPKPHKKQYKIGETEKEADKEGVGGTIIGDEERDSVTEQSIRTRLFEAFGTTPFKVSQLKDHFQGDDFKSACLMLPEMEKRGEAERWSFESEGIEGWQLVKRGSVSVEKEEE